jgi:hypothetical protein
MIIPSMYGALFWVRHVPYIISNLTKHPLREIMGFCFVLFPNFINEDKEAQES